MNISPAEQTLADLINIPLTIDQIQLGSYVVRYVKGGTGPNLLLLHGANIGWGEWYKNIAPLSKSFTVYALDLPGCGRSSSLNYRFADLNRDFLKPIIDFVKVKQLVDFSVMGHSIGGFLALKLALSQDLLGSATIKKIILISSLGFSDYLPNKFKLLAFYPVASFLSKTAMKPTYNNMKNFLGSVMHQVQTMDQEFVEYFFEMVAGNPNTHPFLFLNRLFQPFRVRNEFILIENLSKIKLPVLITAGLYDPLLPINKLKSKTDLIANHELHIFNKSGHVPQLEQSDEFNQAAESFLKKS